MTCTRCASHLDALPPICPHCGEPVMLAGRYAIRKMIGRGGMGEVYLAYDERLATEVAIKRLPARYSDDVGLRESLVKEARILARLTDNAIVRMFDLTETDDGIYLILEYVCGPSLQEMLSMGYQPSPHEFLQIMHDVSKGLEVAHEAGVIHRDLKPANFLVSLQDAERDAFAATRKLPANLRNARIKITDFGIAKVLAGVNALETQSSSGTPAYMAPEQLRAEKPSPETDIYAMGVIAYRLIAGRLPFEGENPAYAHLFVNPPPIEGCSPPLEAVIRKAMAKQRSERFRSAKAFYNALARPQDFAGGGQQQAPPQPPPPPQEPRQRPIVEPKIQFTKPDTSRERTLMVMAGMMLLGMLVLGVYIARGPGATQQQQTAPPIERNDPPPAELRGMPSVNELPPVIEEARGLLSTTALTGPTTAKLAWNIRLPIGISPRVEAIGVDRTIYLADGDGICAVRDGKVAWAFKAHGYNGPRIAPDGRVWLQRWEGESALFCLNRDGKGGLVRNVPRGLAPEISSSKEQFCSSRRMTLGGKALDLDNDCSESAAGPDGTVWVATEGPSIYHARRGEPTVQRATSPCIAKGLFPIRGGAYYYCEDHSLHFLSSEERGWSLKLHGPMYHNLLTDANGVAFYSDDPGGASGAHIHAIDSTGKKLWTEQINSFTVNSLGLDGKGSLYVSGNSYSGMAAGRLLCLK